MYNYTEKNSLLSRAWLSKNTFNHEKMVQGTAKYIKSENTNRKKLKGSWPPDVHYSKLQKIYKFVIHCSLRIYNNEFLQKL